MVIRASENVVICLDTSRSMYRTDLKPNRIHSCINAIKKLIHERYNGDSASAFALVNFGGNSEKVTGFTNFTDEISTALDTLQIQGRSSLGEGLATSIKVVIEELRKIMANIPRILVISDGINTEGAVDPLKMGRLAQGLNIKIDAFRLGATYKLNILKQLSDLTGGKYYYINDQHSLLKSAQDFADGNIKSAMASKELAIENPQFLKKIAANLLRVQDLTENQELRLKQLRGEADYKKCTICFQENDPSTKGSFYLTGRYCPNCNSPYHISCLADWAASQKEDKLRDSGTVRCPHCFYLLKIPFEVSQARMLRSLSGTSSQKQIIPQETEIVPAKLINISELGEDALYTSCPVCHYIFEENQQIVQCGNSECDALYHIDCFKKLENGHCKSCSVKLHLY